MTATGPQLDDFRAAAREWLAENVPRAPRPKDGEQMRAFDLDWQRRQFEGGWAGISWPQEYDGRGLSLSEQFVWHQEYVRARAPYIGACFVGMNHAGPTLIAFGTEEQKRDHLPKILRGEVVWCQGFSEPEAGSDLASLTTHGAIDGNELVVNGRKIWSTNAHHADYQELLLRTDRDAERHRGLTWIICEMDRPGIEVRPILTMAGTHHFAEVTYSDVHLPLNNVVGGVANGWHVAMANLTVERGQGLILDQAELLHAIDQLWNHGLRRLKVLPELDRGKLYSDLAVLRAKGFGLEAMIKEYLLAGQVDGPNVSVLRLAHSELQQETFRLAMDLLGEEGLELRAPRELSEEWVFEYLTSFKASIVAGTSDIQRNIVGERVLGLPRES